jgi:hypothetical protein
VQLRSRQLPAALGVRLPWTLAALLFVFHFAFFGALFHWNIESDLQIHAEIARVGIRTGTWWGTPLPYMAAALAAGWQASLVSKGFTLVCALAVAAKYLVSVRIAGRETGTLAVPSLLVGVIALLSLAFSLPANSMYIGQLPPNVFHNSTVVFLMPLALALFWFSAEYLRKPDNRTIIAVAIAGALNVGAKPSFVFPLLVVFPLAALVRFRLSRDFWKAAGACAFIAALVLGQYLYIYKSGATEEIYKVAGFGGEAQSQVKIDPFRVWSHFSPNIPLSLLASLAFPLVALAAYRRRLWDYDLFRYAAALMGVSLLIFVLLKETGIREFQGNFAWQAMICNYILFLAVLIRAWTLGAFRERDRRSLVVAGAFGAHVVAGVAFLSYYLIHGHYLSGNV